MPWKRALPIRPECKEAPSPSYSFDAANRGDRRGVGDHEAFVVGRSWNMAPFRIFVAD